MSRRRERATGRAVPPGDSPLEPPELLRSTSLTPLGHSPLSRGNVMKSLTPHRMLAGATVLALTTILSVWIATGANPAHAQPQTDTSKAKTLLDPNDTVVLLLDHQTGLFQTVKDVPVPSSGPTPWRSPSSPSWPRSRHQHGLGAQRPQRPDHARDPPGRARGDLRRAQGRDQRLGQRRLRQGRRKTGKKTLVMAGVWTSVCVAFPALQAKAEGYKVYAVIDASGDPSVMASQTTARPHDAGRHHPDHHQRRPLRVPAHLEPPRRRQYGGALRRVRPALPGRDRELQEGPGGRCTRPRSEHAVTATRVPRLPTWGRPSGGARSCVTRLRLVSLILAAWRLRVRSPTRQHSRSRRARRSHRPQRQGHHARRCAARGPRLRRARTRSSSPSAATRR